MAGHRIVEIDCDGNAKQMRCPDGCEDFGAWCRSRLGGHLQPLRNRPPIKHWRQCKLEAIVDEEGVPKGLRYNGFAHDVLAKLGFEVGSICGTVLVLASGPMPPLGECDLCGLTDDMLAFVAKALESCKAARRAPSPPFAT